MTQQYDCFGDPIPEEPPKPKKSTYKKPVPQRFQREPTDIVAWLTKNRPTTRADLQDLRLSLYRLESYGDCEIEIAGETSMGELRIRLIGPVDSVLIVSTKARHFLLGKLGRLRKFDA